MLFHTVPDGQHTVLLLQRYGAKDCRKPEESAGLLNSDMAPHKPYSNEAGLGSLLSNHNRVVDRCSFDHFYFLATQEIIRKTTF